MAIKAANKYGKMLGNGYFERTRIFYLQQHTTTSIKCIEGRAFCKIIRHL